jgi:hypothetical protein
MDATTIQGILDAALGQGIWCALFIYCFWDAQRKNENREKKLMEIIKEQGDSLKECTNTNKETAETLKVMQADMQNIKVDIEIMKGTHGFYHEGGDHHEN